MAKIVLHLPGKEFEIEEFLDEVGTEEILGVDYYKTVDMELPAVGDIITKVVNGALDLRVIEREYSLDSLSWKVKLEIQVATSEIDLFEVIRYFEKEWSIEPF